MDATNSLSNTNKEFIKILSRDHPEFTFQAGKEEHWSPKTKTIIFNPEHLCFGVLHELAHAILNHSNYKSDFELLKLESDAWELAAKIGRKYDIVIDEDHIQNCLDTYRDWLHRRSACPSCGTHVLQQKSDQYHCFNCNASWHVSSGKFVRAYRKTIKNKTA
jgi:hypothetical protein